MTPDPVARFTDLVTGAAPALDVGALAIAAGTDPGLDRARWLRELDRLAHGVDELDGLVTRLFVEERFAGNQADYYDPRNSLLHHVLDRRLGIPITLAVVCLEVGRRAGVSLAGVGMPGHFLVHAPGAQRWLDPFGGGALLDLAGCEALFRASTGAGPAVPFGPEQLAPVGTTAILARMLENLRAVFRARRRPADVEWVLRMRLALPGVDVRDRVELGQVMGQQGRWLDGARYLDGEAAAAGSEHGDLLARTARSLRSRLN